MLHIDFTPFPELTTERLVLRKLKATDAPQIQSLRSDARVNEYLDRPTSTTLDEARAIIEKYNGYVDNKESGYWVLALKTNDLLIGTICLWNLNQEQETAEIGYELHPDYQQQGYMQEAMAAILNYGFQNMQAKAIEAYVSARNIPSIKLLEKTGFQRNLEEEARMDEQDKAADFRVYSLLRTLA